jgi:predicted adenylyl cyclase CyaB
MTSAHSSISAATRSSASRSSPRWPRARGEAPEDSRNIELKAHDPDPASSLEVALALGATDEGWLQQLDTYFNVRRGRLKLREQDGTAELIQYERTDEAIERTSNYRLIPIRDPDGLKDALAAALGILVAVEKSRHLLLWRNVRIHLDEVPGLGSFIELEAVAEPDSDLSGEYENIAELRQALAITDEQILASGYSDELLRVGAG